MQIDEWAIDVEEDFHICMKCFILIAVLGLTCALDLDSQWESFKMIYKKSYKDVDEEAYR
ncbi:hypothetical protein C0Q70_03377 [Pomacea canaliculata]|uniref:Cathepsin propeptide inhibitor domain-containing protein n=1 Tax=Pomacea canaliculata TaxID=400727 RepID=A0A2T7PSK6_POMCA|nr:hypothetical protein C0Q70_03377 [Pomacea canaliculata]